MESAAKKALQDIFLFSSWQISRELEVKRLQDELSFDVVTVEVEEAPQKRRRGDRECWVLGQTMQGHRVLHRLVKRPN